MPCVWGGAGRGDDVVGRWSTTPDRLFYLCQIWGSVTDGLQSSRIVY
jgi:hypothetical protein